jgi:hypothetical protein
VKQVLFLNGGDGLLEGEHKVSAISFSGAEATITDDLHPGYMGSELKSGA